MNRDTYDKILLRLPGMAKAYKEQVDSADINDLTFDQRLELLIDAEVDSQHNHRIERLIANAKATATKGSRNNDEYNYRELTYSTAKDMPKDNRFKRF